METIIISLGGSVIVPNNVNIPFLRKFKKTILNYIKRGNKAIIICGGGSIARKYISSASSLTKAQNTDLDLIGIRATQINAELMRTIFSKEACSDIIFDPTKKIRTNKKIIIGSGWLPGWSTDYDAVLAAKTYNARRIINLSNISYIYDKDPKKYKTAKKIEDITWKKLKKIVGNKWVPGKNAPFDPIASKHAEKLKLRVIVAKGTDIKNLEKILSQKDFKGTIIH